MKTFTRYLVAYITLIFTGYPVLSVAELPDLGSRAAYELPPAKEQELGLKFMNAVAQRSAIIDDPFINHYMQQLGERLYKYAQAANDPIKPHIFVVNSAAINAFTGPGGYIGVNSGLIVMTRSESELAGVLAHELAHMTRHHLARALVKAQAQMLPTLGAMLAAVLVGVASGGAAGAGAINAVLAANMQNSIDSIRQHEFEADRIGIRIMQQTGFDPYALPEFFIQLQRHTSDYANMLPEYLRTHPFAQSRVADLENRLQSGKRVVNSSLDYYLMRARLLFLTTPDNATALNAFTAQLKNNKNPNLIAAAEYGYALALAKKNQYQQAEALLTKLIQVNPHAIAYPLALAEINAWQRKNNTAVNILAKQYKLHPDSYVLLIEYAQALLTVGQANQARKLLEAKSAQYKDELTFYDVLAFAQGKSGHLAAAYQTRAKLFALQGYDRAAEIQLRQALNQADLTQVDRIKIQKNLQELRRKINN